MVQLYGKESRIETFNNPKISPDSCYLLTNSFLEILDVNFVANLVFNRMGDKKIYIGPYPQSLDDFKLISEAGINSILNVQSDKDLIFRQINHELQLKQAKNFGIKINRYPMEDFNQEDLAEKLKGAGDLLHKLLKEGNTVYVHCTAGMSRAAATVIIYLVLYENYTVEEAANFCKKYRPVICPNYGVINKIASIYKPGSEMNDGNIVNFIPSSFSRRISQEIEKERQREIEREKERRRLREERRAERLKKEQMRKEKEKLLQEQYELNKKNEEKKIKKKKIEKKKKNKKKKKEENEEKPEGEEKKEESKVEKEVVIKEEKEENQEENKEEKQEEGKVEKEEKHEENREETKEEEKEEPKNEINEININNINDENAENNENEINEKNNIKKVKKKKKKKKKIKKKKSKIIIENEDNEEKKENEEKEGEDGNEEKDENKED